jgi:hypothetical protein
LLLLQLKLNLDSTEAWGELSIWTFWSINLFWYVLTFGSNDVCALPLEKLCWQDVVSSHSVLKIRMGSMMHYDIFGRTQFVRGFKTLLVALCKKKPTRIPSSKYVVSWLKVDGEVWCMRQKMYSHVKGGPTNCVKGANTWGGRTEFMI